MKLQTTFWSKEIHSFDKLLYINGKTKEIIYQVDLNDIFQSYLFFKAIAKFVKTKNMKDTIKFNNVNNWNNQIYYQFAIMVDNEITPIKWFDLVINDKTVISHDIAFETTLINKSNVRINFGHFPMYYYSHNQNVKLPKYREFNIKARAYKYIANQIKKNIKIK